MRVFQAVLVPHLAGALPLLLDLDHSAGCSTSPLFFCYLIITIIIIIFFIWTSLCPLCVCLFIIYVYIFSVSSLFSLLGRLLPLFSRWGPTFLFCRTFNSDDSLLSCLWALRCFQTASRWRARRHTLLSSEAAGCSWSPFSPRLCLLVHTRTGTP